MTRTQSKSSLLNAIGSVINPATEEEQASLFQAVIDGRQQSQMVDLSGNAAFIGSFGEQVVGTKNDDVSVQFQYNVLDTQFDLNPTETTTTGDGQIFSIDSYAEAVSPTGNGTATIQSRDNILYRPGHGGFADFTAYFEGPGTGYAGPHDDNDGFALKISGGRASFGYIKGGVETGTGGAPGLDDQSDWVGRFDPSNIEIDKLNVYRITFGYLGVSNPTLWIKLDTWQTLHTVQTEGKLVGTHVNNAIFPMRIRAIDGMRVRTGSWNGGTIGGVSESGNPRPFSFPNSISLSGVGAEQASMTLTGTNVGTVALFRSKGLFNGLNNKVKSRLLSYEFSVDVPAGAATGNVVFQISGVQTLSGAATYADINTTSSVMEFDHTAGTGASVNMTVGVPIITSNIDYSAKGGATGTVEVSAEKIGALAYSGDIFAVTAKDVSGNNVTVRVVLKWSESF